MSKSNAADVILRLLATSSDPNKSRRRKRSSRQSSDEEISEGEMTDRSDEQDEEDDEDDEGPVDEYDAEFFGDSKDRAELMAMSEVDCEQFSLSVPRSAKFFWITDRSPSASRDRKKPTGAAERAVGRLEILHDDPHAPRIQRLEAQRRWQI
ncbi:unnamed protein product [Mortierella alpina]